MVPCKDAARGELVKLLASDAEVSSAEDLRRDDGNYYFASCNHHRTLYEGQASKRTCVYEGCDREVKTSKGGLRLCKLHGAKEEKVKTRIQGVRSPGKSTRPPESEARFAPGREEKDELVQTTASSSAQATTLGKYLRLILDGKDEFVALRECAPSGCGPRETWEDLKDQATAYVSKLPRDYMHGITQPKLERRSPSEECPLREWVEELPRTPCST